MSFDGEAHETRRNTALAIGVAVAAVAGVGLLFWIFNSLNGPALAVTPAAVTTTTGTSATSAAAPSDTATTGPPTIASWTPTSTFSLPPPEQPTMTVPAEPAQQPSPPPTTQTPAPPPPAPAPAKPGISNVNLACAKDGGRRVTARLTFTTSARVDIILSAGGQLDRRSAGPGDVSMTSNGRGAEICFARVGDQTVGPVPAT
jgi:hypothetical protein